MPDFPRIATPSEVWAYGTRILTNLDNDRAARVDNLDATILSRSSHAAGDIWTVAARTITELKGTPRSDLMGEDADFEAGGMERKARIDADISSRATQAQILSDATPFPGASIDDAISTRSSHAADAIWGVATRALTTLAGGPRTEIIGEDTSFEAATGRPAKIPRLDTIPAYETAVEAPITMTGTEQTLVEKMDDKIGLLDGYIDLTPMASGNTIVIRQSMKVKAAGEYVVYATETYSGAQSTPLLHIVTKTAKTSIKVTAEQTDAAYVTLDVQFFRRLQA